MRRLTVPTLALVLAACNPNVYVKDGVTDGDTFFLAPRALTDDDPSLQSWVAYSLMRSACQLDVGGDNPARVSTFECEVLAREALLAAWRENREGPDAYLDALAAVEEHGYLEEYVARYLGGGRWTVPADLDVEGFRAWASSRLGRHEAETHLVGSWGYASAR